MDDSYFSQQLDSALNQDVIIDKFTAMLEKAWENASPKYTLQSEQSTETTRAEHSQAMAMQTQLSKEPNCTIKLANGNTEQVTTHPTHQHELKQNLPTHREVPAPIAQSAIDNPMYKVPEATEHPAEYKVCQQTPHWHQQKNKPNAVSCQMAANQHALYGHTPLQSHVVEDIMGC